MFGVCFLWWGLVLELSLMLLALHFLTLNNSSQVSYIWQHVVQARNGEAKLETQRVMRSGCTETLRRTSGQRKMQYGCCWLEALSCIKRIDGGFLVTNLALERQNCVAMGKIIYPHNWQKGQCGILHLKTCKGALSSLCQKGISVAQLSSSPSGCANHTCCSVPCLLPLVWTSFVSEMPARETFSLPDSESCYQSLFVREVWTGWEGLLQNVKKEGNLEASGCKSQAPFSKKKEKWEVKAR